MKKRFCLPAILIFLTSLSASASITKPFTPLPTAYTALAAPSDAGHFTFAVGGDNRSTGHGYPMPPSLAQICREIGVIHPAFTLWTGDVIEGYGDTQAEANQEYDVFLAAAELTGAPMFNAPGNHEFSLDTSLLPVYEKRMGSLYGAFDYGNSHFIALNTNAILSDGKVTSGTLDDAQWNWLEDDLKANQGAANIFVYLHHYVFGPATDDPKLDSGWDSAEDRDHFHAVMVKYGVRAVFTGHNHIYWHTVKDGVQYFISGGSGAPLDASPEEGGYLHYLLITVDGSRISTQILQPWHLQVDYPDGDTPKTVARALVTNTNRAAFTASRIVLRLAAPSAQQQLAVTAVMAYKKKSVPTEAHILSVKPIDHGRHVEVTVSAALIADRTTEITVQPVAKSASRK